MKYLKTFESLENKMTIDLFDFCTLFGMHEAIQKLIILKDNSKAIGFTINYGYEHFYKKSNNIDMYEKEYYDEFVVDESDAIALRIGDYCFNYGYLRSSNQSKRPGVIVNFYDVDIKDEDVLCYISTKKFSI